MKKNRNLFYKLSKDAKDLQSKIEHIKFHNIRNYAIHLFIKSGIAVDYAFPFLLSAMITCSTNVKEGHIPFYADEVASYASVQTIDTSSGIHLERQSYDYRYSEERLEYSTGWVINDQGLYERDVISYRVSSDVDLSDLETLLAMSKEEIEEIVTVTDIQTIQKSSLTPEDEIYEKDALVVVNHKLSEDDVIIRRETILENINSSCEFLVYLVLGALALKLIKRKLVGNSIREKLLEYDLLFCPIQKKDLPKMRRVLEMKKANLAMLDPSLENVERTYQLRRVPEPKKSNLIMPDAPEENASKAYQLRKVPR